MTKPIYLIGVLFFTLFFLQSCTDFEKLRKDMIYLNDSLPISQKIVSIQKDHRLTPGDRLEITVYSLNPTAALAFNKLALSGISTPISGISSGNNISSPNEYLVDSSGNIQFPQVGKIKLTGLTLSEASIEIQSKLYLYLKDPTVSIKLLNYVVYVLGEVARPGPILVPENKISLLEALSESGDLTVFGMRENVLVIREKNGVREFGKMDLRKKDIFSSPYFMLEKGDVVYVQFNKDKIAASNETLTRQFQLISIVLTSITASALVYNAIKK